MLIKVNVGPITDPKLNEIIDDEKSLNDIIEDYNFNTNQGVVAIDGTPINKNDFNKSLKDLKVVEGSYVTFAIKNGGNI